MYDMYEVYDVYDYYNALQNMTIYDGNYTVG